MGWSKYPIRRDATAGGATINFADLDEFEELLLEIRGLQSASGTPDFMLQFSADNGSSIDVTHYIHAGNTGTAGMIFATAVPATTPVAATIELFHWSLARRTWGRINGGREGSATGLRRNNAYNSVVGPWNYLRIANTGAVNFSFATDGAAELFFKKP